MKMALSRKAPEKVSWGVVTSAAGKLIVGLTDKGQICRVSFLKRQTAAEAIAEWQTEWPKTAFNRGAKLDGWEKKPVLMIGTAFQHAVWKAMSEVPSGRVTTYGDIAQHIGNPKAARAVGAACGANPVPYLAPCHRVLAANGTLGGFSGGLDIKEKLLKIEGFL